jgi:hypothetical protein
VKTIDRFKRLDFNRKIKEQIPALKEFKIAVKDTHNEKIVDKRGPV